MRPKIRVQINASFVVVVVPDIPSPTKPKPHKSDSIATPSADLRSGERRRKWLKWKTLWRKEVQEKIQWTWKKDRIGEKETTTTNLVPCRVRDKTLIDCACHM
jgi:hypothetical protein